jgi:hypothetical protein
MTESAVTCNTFCTTSAENCQLPLDTIEGDELRFISNKGTREMEAQIANHRMRGNYDRRVTNLHHHHTGPYPFLQDLFESYLSFIPSCKLESIVIQDMNHRRKY